MHSLKKHYSHLFLSHISNLINAGKKNDLILMFLCNILGDFNDVFSDRFQVDCVKFEINLYMLEKSILNIPWPLYPSTKILSFCSLSSVSPQDIGDRDSPLFSVLCCSY